MINLLLLRLLPYAGGLFAGALLASMCAKGTRIAFSASTLMFIVFAECTTTAFFALTLSFLVNTNGPTVERNVQSGVCRGWIEVLTSHGVQCTEMGIFRSNTYVLFYLLFAVDR